MTQEQIDTIRRNALIEGELQIIEQIPFQDFAGTQGPHLLGGEITKQCVERIREALS